MRVVGVRTGYDMEWAIGRAGRLVSIDAGDQHMPFEVEVCYDGSPTRVWCHKVERVQDRATGARLLMDLDEAWRGMDHTSSVSRAEREKARAALQDRQQVVCDYLGIRGPKW